MNDWGMSWYGDYSYYDDGGYFYTSSRRRRRRYAQSSDPLHFLRVQITQMENTRIFMIGKRSRANIERQNQKQIPPKVQVAALKSRPVTRNNTVK